MIKASIVTVFTLTALNLYAQPSSAQELPTPATNDLWDVSQGTTVTAGSPTQTTDYDLRNMFGHVSNPGSQEAGNVWYLHGGPAGTIHSVEWKTPEPILLKKFRVFAHHKTSRPINCACPFPGAEYQGFSTFRLFVKNGSGEYEQVYEFEATPIDNYYRRTNPEYVDNPNGISSHFPFLHEGIVDNIRGQEFKAEFVQYGGPEDLHPKHAGINGPRVVELDGFGQAAPSVEECCSSVLFLPGIKGSVLKSGDSTIWPPTVFSDDIERLALTTEGESVEDIYVDGILEEFYSTDIYGPFAEFLDSVVAENTINAWQPLAYDWRFSPEKILQDGVKTSAGIKNIVAEIENLAAQSQTGQVTIVGHSMGGLFGKAIIKELEDTGKENLIDSFVMVGTPQLGTPQAAATLLHGDNEGILGGIIVGADDVRIVSQNMPSTYNLLPSATYFDEVTDPIMTFDPESEFTTDWIAAWGNTIDNYTEYLSFMTGTAGNRVKPPLKITYEPEIIRSDLAQNAEQFHETFDEYVFPDHIRVVQVAGWGRPTVKGIEYKDAHPFQNYASKFTSEGDGVVLHPSAITSQGETYYFDLEALNSQTNLSFQHRNLLNSESIKEVIGAILDENLVIEQPFIENAKPPVTSVKEMLIVSTHSPVVLGAYDEVGNFTGVDLDQDLNSEFLTIKEDIPGSSFHYTAESQYIFLPKEGTYEMVYKGIGDGPTTVEIEEFIADTTTPISSYTDIPTTAQTTASFRINTSNPEITIISLDDDSNGTTDGIIATDGSSPPLNLLLDLLKQKLNELTIDEKQEKKIRKEIEELEKKLDKRKRDNEKTLAKFDRKIAKLVTKERLTESTAEEILDLLTVLEAEVDTIPLTDETLLALQEKIQGLDLKNSDKKNLLKRVEKLQNTHHLMRTLQGFTKEIVKNEKKAQIPNEDADILLRILEDIKNAL